jgi:hypothetical protein
MILEYLKVQVYAFRFSSVHLKGILSAIALELEGRLYALGPQTEVDDNRVSSTEDEVLELRPNIYGIGVDLRALWRRWKG